MNRNVYTLFKITAATTVTLSLLAVPYRWHRDHIRHAHPEAAAFALTLSDDNLNTIATGISDSGDVVGAAFDAKGEHIQAFQVHDQKFRLLPTPRGAAGAVAQSVNVRGEVVGSSFTQSKSEAVLWRDGKPTTLATGKVPAAATGINKNGQIAVIAQERQNTPIFSLLWDRGKGRKIGEFAASAIADNGLIVGARQKGETIEAVVWRDGKIATLAPPRGARAAAAWATDGKQRVVGAAQIGEQVRAVVWEEKQTRVLNGLGGDVAFATSVNGGGDIVGASDAGDARMAATLWRGGKPFDLNKMIPPDSGWRAVVATGINNKGFIVGYAVKGERVSGFMLGPVR